jgi:hypothetical protein
VITRVVDEDHSHDGSQVCLLLVIDGETGFIQEILANAALEKIDIELAEVQSVQGCLGLSDRIHY